MRDSSPAESSESVRQRVEAARARQIQRQGKPNALLGTKDIDSHCRADEQGDALLRRAIASLNLSARTYHRVLKVARTMADLQAADALSASHIGEAIGYRRGMEAIR